MVRLFNGNGADVVAYGCGRVISTAHAETVLIGVETVFLGLKSDARDEGQDKKERFLHS